MQWKKIRGGSSKDVNINKENGKAESELYQTVPSNVNKELERKK